MSDFIKKIRTATGDKEIDYEALANRPKIPKKVSDLENDTGFITEEGVPNGDIPTKVSDLENDSGFITDESVPKKVSELENDSGFITDESVPKKVSELQNDVGFITSDRIPKHFPVKYARKNISLVKDNWMYGAHPNLVEDNIHLTFFSGYYYGASGYISKPDVRNTVTIQPEFSPKLMGSLTMRYRYRSASHDSNYPDDQTALQDWSEWSEYKTLTSGVCINDPKEDGYSILHFSLGSSFGMGVCVEKLSDKLVLYLGENNGSAYSTSSYEVEISRIQFSANRSTGYDGGFGGDGYWYTLKDSDVTENSVCRLTLGKTATNLANYFGLTDNVIKKDGQLIFKSVVDITKWTSDMNPDRIDGVLEIMETEADCGAYIHKSLTKISELSNDVGLVTYEAIPKKLSELSNDEGFITRSSVPKKVSELSNDKGFITSSDLPTHTSDLANDSGFINTDSMASYVDAKLAAYQSTALKLTAPNGDVYVVSVSDSGQIVLTKQVSATNLITSPITLTAATWHNLDYSLGLESNKYYTVQIKFTNADGTETVKTGSIKALDMTEDVGSQCACLISQQTIDPNVMFVVYDKIALVSSSEGAEPDISPNENAAAIMLSAGESYAYTSAVLESITEAVLDSISFPLTITPSSMTFSSNEDCFISKPYSGSAFDTSKTYNVIGSIVIGGTTYELSVSNEAPIIYGLYDEDPYIELLAGDDDNHRIYIRSANGYVTIELKSYADESTTCSALTIDSITEGGSPLAGEWATPVTFADASTRFSKDKKYTYSGTIGLENNKAYKLNVTVDGTTSDVIMWANAGWNDAGNQPKMSSGYNTTPKLPDFTDCRSHIGGEHYEADRCLIEFNKNVTPGYTSLTINSITEADTAPNGAWSLPMTVNMPESYVSECMFSFSGTFGLEKGKAYKIITTEGETQKEYVGIAKAESDYLPNVIVLDTTPPVRTATTRELKLYDNATLVGETSSSNVHEFTNRCAMSFDYDSSISSIVIDSITEIEIPVTGAWSVPQTYSSLTENATSGYTYSGLIGLAEYTSYKINVTIDGTTKDITSTYNGRNNGTVYCNFALDDGGSHYIQIRDKGVYLSYGDSYRIGPSDNNCSVIIHNGSYSSITINSITKVTA